MNGVALLYLQVPKAITESGSRTDKHWDLSEKERPWFPKLSTKIWGNHTGLTSAKSLPTSFSISPLLGRLEKTVQTACFVSHTQHPHWEREWETQSLSFF